MPDKKEDEHDKLFFSHELFSNPLQLFILVPSFQEHPQIKTLLSRALRCAVCGQYFLKLYMMCVEYVDAHKILSTSNGTGVIPTLAYVCSYRCFIAHGRNFFSAEAVAQI